MNRLFSFQRVLLHGFIEPRLGLGDLNRTGKIFLFVDRFKP